jgi:hypothetical protein
MPWDGSVAVDKVWRQRAEEDIFIPGFALWPAVVRIRPWDMTAEFELDLSALGQIRFVAPVMSEREMLRSALWALFRTGGPGDIVPPVSIRGRLIARRSVGAAARNEIARLSRAEYRELRKGLKEGDEDKRSCVRRLDCLYSRASKAPRAESADADCAGGPHGSPERREVTAGRGSGSVR